MKYTLCIYNIQMLKVQIECLLYTPLMVQRFKCLTAKIFSLVNKQI